MMNLIDTILIKIRTNIIKIFHFIVIVTYSLCAVIVQRCTILLNRNLQDAIRNVFIRTTRITSSHHTNQNYGAQTTSRNT
jgi:hypothetical protein